MAMNISQADLRKFFLKVFKAAKVPSKIGTPVVDGLIQTSMRGVDSHGIRLMPAYINNALNGKVNLSPKITIVKTSRSTARLDADGTFGIAAGMVAMKHACKLASKNGIGAVSVVNSTHFGSAAIYSLMAAENGLIGMSFTQATPLVMPFGGTTPYLGTNPICLAAPCEGEGPFCIDMATSTVARNKILSYREKGKPLENGWATDKDGNPTTDSNLGTWLLPLGGYKGYGLGLMVEVLCSVLTGMEFDPHLKSMYDNDPVGWKKGIGHFFIAIDIAKFQDPQVFKKRLRSLVDELRAQQPAKSFERVLVAGDPEKIAFAVREKDGIPLTDKDVENFAGVAKKLGVRAGVLKPK